MTIFVFGAILEPYVDSVDILDTGEKLQPMSRYNDDFGNGIKHW